MQGLHSASTLRAYAPAEPGLLVNPHPKLLKSFSTDIAHRKSMHWRQKTHKRVKASWWTLASVRSAVYLKQAAPGSSWIRTLAVHFELLIETGNCMSGPSPPAGHPKVDEVQIPVQPAAVLVTCACCTFPPWRDELWKQKEMFASGRREQELCSS